MTKNLCFAQVLFRNYINKNPHSYQIKNKVQDYIIYRQSTVLTFTDTSGFCFLFGTFLFPFIFIWFSHGLFKSLFVFPVC